MLAMTFQITLPQTTDMEAFRRRVESEITTWSANEGLLFVAHGMTQAGVRGALHHTYAPFFVWANTSRMGSYLWSGEHFAELERAFGRPRVQTWAVTSVQFGAPASNPGSATSAILATEAAVQDETLAQRATAHKADALASVSQRDTAIAVRGIDPGDGTEMAYNALYDLPKKRKLTPHARTMDLVGITLPQSA